MNGFFRLLKTQQRNEALRNIKPTEDMMKIYVILKSLCLHIDGRYDVIKYGPNYRLNETSFGLECGDMKLTCRGITSSITSLERQIECAHFIAILKEIRGEQASDTFRRYRYDPISLSNFRNVYSKNEVVPFDLISLSPIRTGVTISNDKFIPENHLFESEANIYNRILDLLKWKGRYNMIVAK